MPSFEDFLSWPPDSIVLLITVDECPYVGVKGQVDDWALYKGQPGWGMDRTRANGDKVFDIDTIRAILHLRRCYPVDKFVIAYRR